MLSVRNITLLVITGLFNSGLASAAPPKLTALYPAGAQRGTSLVVTASGEFSTWPVEAWCDQPSVTIAAEKDTGKYRITVAADALPGVCWIRAHNAEGASTLRPFLIDQLPEQLEVEPNDALAKYAEVPLPVIVNSKLQKNGDVDGYTFKLQQGETIVAALQANWQLGSPMDSVLQVGELVSRRVSSALDEVKVDAYVLVQDHDTRGLDPLLRFTAPRDGLYFARVFAFPAEPGATIGFAGGDNYIYRLTLTTGGVAEFSWPLASAHDAAEEIAIAGWNMPGNAPRFPVAKLDNDATKVTRAFALGVAGAVDVPRVEMRCQTATDAANQATGEAITLPVMISGRLPADNMTQAFRFAAKKNDKVRLEVFARELGLPLDGLLSISDHTGKQLHSIDDTQKQADPEFIFTAPHDGEYVVGIRDLHHRGGERFAYRLLAEPVKQDFSVTLATDNFVVTPDKPLELPVTIERRDGYADEINIAPLWLPEGVTAEPVKSAGTGDTAKSVKLILKTTAETKAWRGPIQFIGEAPGQTRRVATFAPGLPGVQRSSSTWLTVMEKAK